MALGAGMARLRSQSRNPIQGQVTGLTLKAVDQPVEFLATDKPSIPLRSFYGAVWAGLTYYAFNIAPGGSTEAAAMDLELAKKMITTPFDGSGSSIFAAVFNSLGVLPAVYGALLLPGDDWAQPDLHHGRRLQPQHGRVPRGRGAHTPC